MQDLIGHWPKSCQCGREWDPDAWEELPLSGHAALNTHTRIETRMCECGNPLAIVVGLPEE